MRVPVKAWLFLLAACGPKVTGSVTTLAGSAEIGLVDGPGAAARFDLPTGLAVDASGAIYVADAANHRIRQVDSDGAVTTIAGTGTNGGFVDGPGAQAQFAYPYGLALDGAGGLVIADHGNSAIRRVDLTTHVVTTISGGPGHGYVDGPIGQAKFFQPEHVVVDRSTGSIYVADTWNHAIRKIDVTAGTVSTVAGTGVAGYADGPGATAQFFLPGGVAVDDAGTLYISEQGNNTIRRIASDGTVSTLAGPVGGGTGYVEGCDGNARFSFAARIALADGGLLIVDAGNANVLRSVSFSGCTKLVAGKPSGADTPGVDGPAASATFAGPLAAVPASDGRIYIVDEHRVRVYTP